MMQRESCNLSEIERTATVGLGAIGRVHWKIKRPMKRLTRSASSSNVAPASGGAFFFHGLLAIDLH
jgi:hypothetical protein